MGGDASDKFHDTAEQLKKSFENFNSEEELQALQKTAKEVADVATDFIRKYPIQSVIGAAAVGFIIGSLLKKK